MKPFGFQAKLARISTLCSLVSLLVSGFYFVLWAFFPELKEFSGGGMKLNTAVGLLSAGVALLLLGDETLESRSTRLWMAYLCSSVALVIGLLTSAQYATGRDFGIDQLLATDFPSDESKLFPGRMSPTAALCFVWLGLTLLTLNVRRRKGWHPAIYFLLPLLWVSSLSLLGYLYAEKAFYQFGPYIRISWQTAFCFFFLAIGLLFARRQDGPADVLSSPGLGGVTARRLIPIVVAVPLLLGWLGLNGQLRGYFNVGFGAALLVISLITIFMGVVIWVARHLNALESTGRELTLREGIAMKKAAASDARIRDFAEAMPTMAFIANSSGEVIYYNKAWAIFMGAQDNDDHGWNWSEAIFPEHLRRTRETWEECLRNGTPFEAEYLVRRSDGEYRWLLGRAVPVRDEAGSVVEWYGTNTDIHDLRKLSDDLAHALRAQDEFLSIASHELKTPLTSLKLQSQLFKRKLDKGEQAALQKEKLSEMAVQTDRQVSRLNRLVDDMLDISRIRTGQLVLERERFDLRDLAKETLERMKSQFNNGGTLVSLQGLGRPLIGNWDKLRVEQVLSNLLTNAIRYGDGKPIDVSVGQQKNGSVLISVRDQGIGIAEEMQSKIFERFERAVNPSQIRGLGLGLFIAKQIVKAHGGRIWVESRLGKGSTFYVELPTDRVEEGSEVVDVAPPSGSA